MLSTASCSAQLRKGLGERPKQIACRQSDLTTFSYRRQITGQPVNIGTEKRRDKRLIALGDQPTDQTSQDISHPTTGHAGIAGGIDENFARR